MSVPTRSGEPLLRLSGVCKAYPGVQALSDVDLEIAPGEVHALVGENGAGKSTLIKIIGGVELPDRGRYELAGSEIRLRSSRDARALGISVLHQERSIVPTFSVGENVLLDVILSARAGARFDKKSVFKRAEAYLEMIGVDLAADQPVSGLSAAQLQLIEIARALSVEAQLLVLDEPTASIALHESNRLLDVVRTLSRKGVAVLYVSHKLEEVFDVCQRISVLRDGRCVAAAVPTGALNRSELVNLMVGRAYVAEALPARAESQGAVVLKAHDLRHAKSASRTSFELRRGEIVGWYGLIGSGRTEIAHLLVGAERPADGEMFLDGRPMKPKSVAHALRRYRVGYVSEDRQGEGLFLAHSITRNISAATWRRLRRRIGLLDIAAEKERAESLRKQLEIRTPTVNQLVANLSGGNKQKVSLAKWLVASPEILIIDEPTIGIDIRTKYEVHALISRLANQGMSVIVISSDLVEIVRLVDRIEVFHNGGIVSRFVNSHDYEVMSQRAMRAIFDDEDRNSKEPAPAE